MFDPKECDHVPMSHKSEAEQIIEQLREENDLLKGCIMEICEVLFAE